MRSYVSLLSLALAACGGGSGGGGDNPGVNTRVSQDVYNRIAECGGGVSSSTTASLSAKIAQDLMSGNLSAGVENDIKAAIVNDPNVPASDKARVADAYLACLKDIRTGS